MAKSNALHHGLIHLYRNGNLVHKIRFFVHIDGTISGFDDRMLSLGTFEDWGSFMIALNDNFQAEIHIMAVND